jgi:hypothetical protein
LVIVIVLTITNPVPSHPLYQPAAILVIIIDINITITNSTPHPLYQRAAVPVDNT